jgi:hypothetical protein
MMIKTAAMNAVALAAALQVMFVRPPPPTGGSSFDYDVVFLFTGNPTGAGATITNDGDSGTDGVNGSSTAALTNTDSTYVTGDGGDSGNSGYDNNWTVSQNFTLACWFEIDNETDLMYLIGRRSEAGANDPNTGLYVNAGKVVYYISDNNGSNRTGGEYVTTLPSNTWHHAAVTYSSAESVVYVDGLPIDSATTALTGVLSTNSVPFGIGARCDKGSYNLQIKGSIDDMIIDGTTLTPNEILNIYYAGRGNLSSATPAQSGDLLDPSCIAAYFMTGDGTGDEIDRSGNDNTLDTVGGSCATSTNVPSGYSGASRESDSIRMMSTVSPSSFYPLSSAITVACWVKPSNQEQSACMVGYGDNVAKRWALFIDGKDLQFRMSMDAGSSFTDTDAPNTDSFAAGSWVHGAATWDGSDVILYVNGSPVTTNSVSGTLADATGQSFSVGELDNGNNPAEGLYDEVIVFNRALSAAEISDLYTNGIDGTKGGND